MTKHRLGTFSDVKQVLDSALAAGGGSYALDTHGQAVHFRHRCYTFRKQYAEQHSLSPYDVIVMRRIPDDSCTVTFELARPKGVFMPAAAATADLDAEARELALKLGGSVV